MKNWREVICFIADVDAAVSSARAAFVSWSKWTGIERGRVLLKASQLLRQKKKELAEMEVMDTGKPIQEAMVVDIDSGRCKLIEKLIGSDWIHLKLIGVDWIVSGADCLEYFGGLAGTLRGSYVPLQGGSFGYVHREPLGVCGGIGAWNYPLQIACWKAAPALAW